MCGGCRLQGDSLQACQDRKDALRTRGVATALTSCLEASSRSADVRSRASAAICGLDLPEPDSIL